MTPQEKAIYDAAINFVDGVERPENLGCDLEAQYLNLLGAVKTMRRFKETKAIEGSAIRRAKYILSGKVCDHA